MYLNLTSLHFIQDRISLSKKVCEVFFLPITCHTSKSFGENLQKQRCEGRSCTKQWHIKVACVWLTVRYNPLLFITPKKFLFKNTLISSLWGLAKDLVRLSGQRESVCSLRGEEKSSLGPRAVPSGAGLAAGAGHRWEQWVMGWGCSAEPRVQLLGISHVFHVW